MRTSSRLTFVFCSIVVVLFLHSCGSKHSLRISIPSDGQSFTLILDGEVILARSFGTDISRTDTRDMFGMLIGMEYIFISTGGERIKIDIDEFTESGKFLHGTGEHILEIKGAKYTAKAEYTFDDKFFKNIKVTLILPPGTESSEALFAEGTRPR